MTKRFDLKKVNPMGYSAMLTFHNHLDKTSLNVTERNLIQLRASQLNGCSYCIDSHAKEAREAGESEQRIYCLSAWRDTTLYTESERAILALTEEVTQISARVSEATYQQAVRILGETKTGEVLLAAIVINSWNRIGVAMEMMPE